MKLLIIVEKAGAGYSAYSPDLEGCVASGPSRDDVERSLREAIEFQLDGLRQDGHKVPEPHSYATYVEVAA